MVLTASPSRRLGVGARFKLWRLLRHGLLAYGVDQRQGVGRTPHKRGGHARGKKDAPARRGKPELCARGEGMRAARAGNRAPIHPRGMLQRGKGEREEEEESEEREEENRGPTWNTVAPLASICSSSSVVRLSAVLPSAVLPSACPNRCSASGLCSFRPWIEARDPEHGLRPALRPASVPSSAPTPHLHGLRPALRQAAD
nr:unnamed protein product [Digitaria exilis]